MWAMWKKVVVNVAIVFLMGINIFYIAQQGINIINAMAIIICVICLALNVVERTSKDNEE